MSNIKSRFPIILGVTSLVLCLSPTYGLLSGIIGAIICKLKLSKQEIKSYRIGLKLNLVAILVSLIILGLVFIVFYKSLV